MDRDECHEGRRCGHSPGKYLIASILAITDNKLKPVPVEPDIRTYNFDISQVEQHITERARAIMVVHLSGQACWSEELVRLAERYLNIIKDNAQAAGALVQGTGCNSRDSKSVIETDRNKNLETVTF